MKAIAAFIAALILFALPHQAAAAIIVMLDTQITTGATVPTPANVYNSVYDQHATTTTSPVATHYSSTLRLWNTVSQSYEPITAISALSFQLGRNTAGTFDVPYTGSAFAPSGGGSPQFTLHNVSGVDITASVYGQNVVGTTLPPGVMAITVTNQTIPPSFGGGGGGWDPMTYGAYQSGKFTGSLSTTGGTAGPESMMSTLTFVPEPGTSALAIIGLSLFIHRRRR